MLRDELYFSCERKKRVFTWCTIVSAKPRSQPQLKKTVKKKFTSDLLHVEMHSTASKRFIKNKNKKTQRHKKRQYQLHRVFLSNSPTNVSSHKQKSSTHKKIGQIPNRKDDSCGSRLTRQGTLLPQDRHSYDLRVNNKKITGNISDHSTKSIASESQDFANLTSGASLARYKKKNQTQSKTTNSLCIFSAPIKKEPKHQPVLENS